MPKRPFKILYLNAFDEKVGRVVACSYPESVIRSCSLALLVGRADTAAVFLEGEKFAEMSRLQNGDIRFEVEEWGTPTTD